MDTIFRLGKKINSSSKISCEAINAYWMIWFYIKIMEYLSSSVSVAAYKLDGIPDEYNKYIQCVEVDPFETLKKKLVGVCEMPFESREK